MSDQTEIIVHPVSPKGGRKVTVHALGVDVDLGVRTRRGTLPSSCVAPAWKTWT
ncbi:hypothetical protein [Streptomyces sp. WM6368]|uniref:hypothetical protein n=1 Tax=Streptomyces sp. WM6368 TaxID=1415554 RepID=UPI0018FE9088|nr:hypothetical protein [Streptomyces sp. WM6368]